MTDGIDLDGVLYVEDEPLPGAREAVADLRRSGPALRFVINYRILNRAFRQLMDGAELIALQKNRFWLTPDGLSLDVGPSSAPGSPGSWCAPASTATRSSAHRASSPTR